ncbi:polysaccharide biosynthesis protein [Bacillus freudenreichii]|nr:polysaccharide biosynthesis protein [Bacillus freudenreichii]
MKKNIKSFGKDSIKYMPSKVIEGIMGILVIVFYTRLFPPSEYGLFSLIVGMVGVITTITVGWLNHSLLRYYEENKNNNKFFTTLTCIWLIINITVVFLYLIVNIFSSFSELQPLNYYLIPFFVLGNSWILLSTLLRAARKAGLYSLLLSFVQIMKFLLVVFLVKMFNIGVLSIILSTIICEFMVVIISIKKMNLGKRIYWSLDHVSKPLIKKFFNYGFPLIGVALVTWILSISDRYVIAFFKGTGESGIYTVGYSLVSQPLNLIISSIMLSAFPIIINTWNKHGKRETENFINKIMHYYLIIMIPAVFGIFMLREEIFKSLADKDYFLGNEILPWISLGFLFLGLTQYVNKILELKQKTISLFNIIAIVAVINLILNLIFVPYFGMLAAAITTMVSYMIYFFISLFLTKKMFSLKFGIASISRIIIASFIMCIAIVLIKNYITNILLLILVIFIAGVVYFLMLYLLGEIRAELKSVLNNFCKKKIDK